MGFSRQEYWNGLFCPPPGDLPDPGMELGSPVSGSLPLVPLGSPSSVVCESCSVMSDSSQPHGLYSPWNSPGQDTGAGIHSLLQGIFLTQGSNPGLLHYRWILYQLSHQGSPRTQQNFFVKFTNRLCGQYKGSVTYYPAPPFFKDLFIYLCLCLDSVALCRLSPVAGSGGCSSFQCTGFSLWLLLLQSMGSRVQA
ncbi:unnamed protein product [Rangifer tarandus platyrhynchus]|uniref:Uncharacterized protein n=2 Tax=Rangifer tarandus platyrhynchus TaxID=3082113 RepID=A0AC59YVC0_RANTA|nr:unnamed protein product [Rangifer tarandus platyrhynchus]